MFWTGPSGSTASTVGRERTLVSLLTRGIGYYWDLPCSFPKKNPRCPKWTTAQTPTRQRATACGCLWPGQGGILQPWAKIYQGHELTGDSNALCPSFSNNPPSRRRPGPEEAPLSRLLPASHPESIKNHGRPKERICFQNSPTKGPARPAAVHTKHARATGTGRKIPCLVP